MTHPFPTRRSSDLKRFSMPLTLNSAIPYQGMMVIAAALEKAGSTKPDAIAKGLGSVDIKPEDMVVSSNFVKFDEHGRNTGRATRSEEHTSELKSLMRISYAVFCLKKKNE